MTESLKIQLKGTFDLAFAIFLRSILFVLHAKIPSHDVDACSCVPLASSDAKPELNVTTLLYTFDVNDRSECKHFAVV